MFIPSIKSKIFLLSFIISLALVTLSVFAIIRIFPSVLRTEVYKNVQLIQNTEQYDRFLELPIPLIFKVHFFNVENPHDIVANGSKPILKEVGPYVYKEWRKKTIETMDDEEDTVSYRQRETFEFDPIASGNFSEDDYVTLVNAPMMSILQMAEKMHPLTADLVSQLCLQRVFQNLNTIFIKVKVRDILFDGVQFCFKNTSSPCSVVCSSANITKNIDSLENGTLKFSLFNYKNKSDDGLYTVKRGIKNVQTLGHIVMHNKLTHTKLWQKSNSTCDEVKGTDATIYQPEISKSSVLEIYSTDICRYVEIYFVKEEMYHGIQGYKFAAGSTTLRPSTPNPEDDCFCVKQTKDVNGEDNCFLDGVIDMQPCTEVPVLLSFPHFLWADDVYRDNVDGMSPDEDLHETYLIVEPITGTPLEGMERIQINIVLRPIAHISRLKQLPRLLLPLVWIEEGVSLTDVYIDKLQKLYFDKVKIVNIAKWSFLGVSISLAIISGTYFLYKQF